eukprot:CAMPEP_0170494624 /NCGR_PEP_ID=MMETSP0208-20121228/14748_1 /TAXON_ID=197538 /ORGANISM="Strombidium inclinatum, Strain S3" /LENGTH=55 /DNA_ID=CAMNT_0010770707 /DNA_START=173 /DNA_END=340 /DNA_ORIENTATION=+
MICITGDEANGWQISPNSVTTFFFFMVAFIVCLHLFLRNPAAAKAAAKMAAEAAK